MSKKLKYKKPKDYNVSYKEIKVFTAAFLHCVHVFSRYSITQDPSVATKPPSGCRSAETASEKKSTSFHVGHLTELAAVIALLHLTPADPRTHTDTHMRKHTWPYTNKIRFIYYINMRK